MSPHHEDPPDLLRALAHHRPLWIRLAAVLGALAMFALGVVGWLIPVVTGVPFYVAGLALLAVASERARRIINRLERKLPRRTRWTLRRGLDRIPSAHLRRLVVIPTRESADPDPTQP